MAPQDRDILPHEYVVSSNTSVLTDKSVRVKPINYEIGLFDLELGGAFSFQGIVNIEVKIESAITSITLNAHRLHIHSAEIDSLNIQRR